MRKPIRPSKSYYPTAGVGVLATPSISSDYATIAGTSVLVGTGVLDLDLDSEWDDKEDPLQEEILSDREQELCNAIDELEKIVFQQRQDIEIEISYNTYLQLIESAFDNKSNFDMIITAPDGRFVHLKIKG